MNESKLGIGHQYVVDVFFQGEKLLNLQSVPDKCLAWTKIDALVVVVVGGGGGGGGFLGFLAKPAQNAPCPSAKTHLPNAAPYAVRDPNRWQLSRCPGKNCRFVWLGKMAGFKGYFAHISLENTPNFHFHPHEERNFFRICWWRVRGIFLS